MSFARAIVLLILLTCAVLPTAAWAGDYDSLAAAVEATRYRVNPRPGAGDAPAGYEVANPAQRFGAAFGAGGVELRPTSEVAGWRLGLRLHAWGYGEHLVPPGAAVISASGNRVEYRYAVQDAESLTEWYVNTARGIEQGFTLARPPAGARGSEPLTLVMAVTGDLTPRLAPGGQAIQLASADGTAVLGYSGLHAWDARGRTLPSRLAVEAGQLRLVVDDRAAVYPVTVDPLLASETRLIAGDGAEGDSFGFSVAISGDTVVVGAPFHDRVAGANDDTGQAYVYVRSATGWIRQTTLTASDGAAGDNFGWSVAISGNTVVVGAPSRAGANAGQAYVYVRNGTTWSAPVPLTANDGVAGDNFGFSVAIDGNTVVVGAPGEPFAGANDYAGEAYVYVRSATGWIPQATLTANDGAAGDNFGFSVAIDGNTVVVGAPGEPFADANDYAGEAYVYVRSGTTWSAPVPLTANDGAAGDSFGFSVAIDGNTVVVGAPGHNGDTADAGQAYVYVRSGTTWSAPVPLTASDGGALDAFGLSVAISGDTVVVGAPGHDDGQGQAYVYGRSGVAWTPQTILAGSDGAANDRFGRTVAISGNTAVGGAPFHGAPQIGQAYVYALTPAHTLTVASSNPSSGVSITVSPSDSTGKADDDTPFTRVYGDGTRVTLLAPATAGGNGFGGWSGCTSVSGRTCTVMMSTNRTVTASFVQPDVATTVATTVATAAPGATIAVNNTVKNNASVAVGEFTVGFYLDSVDPLRRFGTRTITGLAPGAVSAASTSLTIPASTPPGTYRILVRADDGLLLAESDEANNLLATGSIAVGPDLVVTALTAPAKAQAGQVITLNATVQNLAAALAQSQSSTLAFYLSGFTFVSSPAVDILLGTRVIPGLGAGATSAGPTTVTIPAGVSAGTYVVVARADELQSIAEARENNNAWVTATPILIGPDIAVTVATGPPGTAPGLPVTVSNTVVNNGTAPATFAVGFHLAPLDQAFGVPLGSRTVTALGVSATSTAVTSLMIPPDTPAGVYRIVVRVGDGTVAEANEANNVKATGPMTIALPDLVVTAVTAPASAAPGATISTGHTVRNAASAPGTAPASRSAVYLLSTSAAGLSTGTVDRPSSRPVTADTVDVPALGPGRTATVAKTITISSGLPLGTYIVVARADDPNAIVEADETNNVFRALPGVRITIGPDLVVTAVTAPATARAGERVTLGSTVKNVGSATTQASTLAYHLSDNVLGTGAIPIPGATRAIPALGAGATSAGATVVTIQLPGNVSTGTYFVIARADDGGAIAEADETNNDRAAATAITVGPDLAVTALTAPAAAQASQRVTLGSTVKNLGSATTQTSTLTYYLTGDSAGTVVLATLGTRVIPGLGAGATSVGTTAVTIPFPATPGTYFIRAIADDTNAIIEADETNNDRAAATVITIGPDLAVTVATGPATGAPGVPITVANTVINNGTAPATFSVGFFLSTDDTEAGIVGGGFLGSRTVTALGAGATSAAATAVTIPFGNAPGVYRILVLADSDLAFVEADKANNLRATGPITIAWPDLVVTAVTAPAVAAAGGPISISHTVRNAASAPGAAPASVSRLCLSFDGALGCGGRVDLGTVNVPALGPGLSATVAKTFTVPPGTPPGAYFVVAVADDSNRIVETSEDNNVRVTPTAITVGPDLVVAALTAPAAAQAGQLVSLSGTVKNLGGAMSANQTSTLAYYLSRFEAVNLGDPRLATRTVPGLVAGGVSTASTSVMIPANVSAGRYFVIARADDGRTNPETDENNNTRTTAISIGPDLVVTALTAPAAAPAGQRVTVSSTVKNVGSAMPAGQSFTLIYFFAPASDTSSGAVGVGSRVIAGLGAGATSTGPTTITIPDTFGTLGSFFIVAIADYSSSGNGGVVVEADEGNNERAAAIILGSDLAVTVATGPTSGAPGLPVTVASTVVNNGAAPATFSVGFYLSADETFEAGVDVPLGSRTVTALGAGAASAAATSLTIPPGTAAGVYRILVRADDSGILAEPNEANDVRATGPITVALPDLVVTAVTAPATARPGQPVTLSSTVKNLGSAMPVTRTSALAYYLSTDAVLDDGDLRLADTRGIPGLGAGATSAGATAVMIPPGITGTYFVIARADDLGIIGEADETNNVRATATRILIGADLAVTLVMAPPGGAPGLPVTVTYAVVNTGTAPATFFVGFRLSTDDTFDGSDVFLGQRGPITLEAGATSSGATSLMIPANTSPGVYRILSRTPLMADANGANNVKASEPITIAQPDLVVDAVTAPASAVVGDTISISHTVRNAAAAPGAAPASVSRLYLSADTSLDGADIDLGTVSVPALGPGLTATVSTTVTIPPGTPPGAYFVIVRADDAGTIVEADDTNNARVTATSIIITGRDLVVTAVTAPATAQPGQRVTLSSTVQNTGTAASQTSILAFYLSGAGLPGGSVLLPETRVIPGLGAGESSTGDTVVTLPAVPAGTYSLTAVADVSNVIVEVDETNNTRASAPILIALPDLVVTAVTAPAAQAGQQVTVSGTVQNTGIAMLASQTSILAYYLSGPGLPAGGVLLTGTRTVPGLGTGEISAGDTVVTLPAGLAGTYSLTAFADASGAVAEVNESNNFRATPILITAGAP